MQYVDYVWTYSPKWHANRCDGPRSDTLSFPAARQTIQELSLELTKQNQVAEHRENVRNDSLRRQKSDLSRRSSGAEDRVKTLEVNMFVLHPQFFAPPFPP